MVGIFPKPKRTVEELEKHNEGLILEEEVAVREVSIAEKKAAIGELKKRYGSDWKNTLGLKGKLSISDLRHALMSMNQGLKGQYGNSALHNPRLSPLPKRPDQRGPLV